MLIDTHSHLYLKEFDDDRDEAIERAKTDGIHEIYLPNIDSTSIDSMLAIEKKYKGICYAMMGLHPCSVKENFQKELELVRAWLDKRPFCAVGEIGIDLYWDQTFLKEQREAFSTQMEWAKEFDIPIVIHSRESIDLIIEMVQSHKTDKLNGIFHCFTGSIEQAKKIIDLDFYLGIGGVLTFKNSGLDKTVKELPLERMVLETDSPYLAPVPYRGKRNESAYIKLIANKLSEVKGMDFMQIADITSANVKKIFGKKSLAYTTVY